MSTEHPVPRRVVTGHTPAGISVFVSDGPVPVSRHLTGEGVSFHEVWNTEGAPAPIDAVERDEPTQRQRTLAVPPPALGTKIRINEFEPGFINEHGLQSPVHRTSTIDYGIVVEGEITLVLDDSETTLRAGDIVVQRGTDHAWVNRTDAVAKVVFVLVDATFAADLASTLPGGLAGLMRQGPDD